MVGLVVLKNSHLWWLLFTSIVIIFSNTHNANAACGDRYWKILPHLWLEIITTTCANFIIPPTQPWRIISILSIWEKFFNLVFWAGHVNRRSRPRSEYTVCWTYADEWIILFVMSDLTGTWRPFHIKLFAIDFWPLRP